MTQVNLIIAEQGTIWVSCPFCLKLTRAAYITAHCSYLHPDQFGAAKKEMHQRMKQARAALALAEGPPKS